VRKFQLGLVVLGLVGVLACASIVWAAEAAVPASAGESGGGLRGAAAALGAGLVGAMSILAAGLAIGRVGSAGVGAIAEKPELFVRVLIFVALAEGLAVLGFALAVLMMRV